MSTPKRTAPFGAGAHARGWLITGTTSGFGAAFVKNLLARDDKVIATARNTSKISHLEDAGALVLKLDLTDGQSILNTQAKAAVVIHSKIDVLVSSARYAHFGTVEEDNREDWINQFQPHVFGTLAVTRAFLPQFRKQGAGTIIFLGSTAAWGGIPTLGAYCSSKSALPGPSLHKLPRINFKFSRLAAAVESLYKS